MAAATALLKVASNGARSVFSDDSNPTATNQIGSVQGIANGTSGNILLIDQDSDPSGSSHATVLDSVATTVSPGARTLLATLPATDSNANSVSEYGVAAGSSDIYVTQTGSFAADNQVLQVSGSTVTELTGNDMASGPYFGTGLNMGIAVVPSQAPAIPAVTTNPSGGTINSGSNTSFTSAATGSPTPTQQWQVSTDGGATFSNISNGGVYSGATTSTLSITGGNSTLNGYEYRDVFTNTQGSATTTAATLTVDSAPVIATNPTSPTVNAGGNTSFTASATGNPTPTVQWQVSTNGGQSFTNITNGGVYSGATTNTLTITGATVSMNTYEYQAVYSNTLLGAGSPTIATTNAATLTVDQAPAITSVNHTAAIIGTAFSYTFTTTGFPVATLSESGTLPTGVTFTDNGNGTATLAGTPSGSTGSFPLTVTAHNGIGSDATQSFSLVAETPTVITSTNTALATTGSAFSFTVTTTGSGTHTLAETGALPSGVTFTDNGDGTATLAGTPASGGGSSYPLTITATGLADSATQSFTLNVTQHYVVTNLNPSGSGSLAAAVAAAVTTGGAADITFQSNLTGTITEFAPDTNSTATGAGPSALVIKNNSSITIDGADGGSGLTLDGGGTMRQFFISSGSALTINDLTLTDGAAQGGSGGSGGSIGAGGGGGAGMGGVVFNQGGSFTATNSTFENNSASGGSGGVGSAAAYKSGGGGGGMGASGGSSGNFTGGPGGGVNGGTQGSLAGAAQAGGFGGGGGGSATSAANYGTNGAAGGFGGGGGGAGSNSSAVFGTGGAGGFGGGGGANNGTSTFGGGSGSGLYGGGGAGMGGAIFNDAGTINLQNSTLTNNTAQGGPGAQSGAGLGGAVFNYNGTLNSTNVTISGNTADGGRGIFSLGAGGTATAVINNTIIGQADTTATDFVGTTLNSGTSTTSGVGNLIRSESGFAGTVVSSADPLLGSLANNGGDTRTLLPASNSPIIHAGSIGAIAGATTDQLGNARTDSGNVDIGSIEVGSMISTPVVTGNPTSGTVNTGGNTSFTSTATGTPTPTEQWQISTNGGSTFTNISNGGVYSGATTATLSITGATAGMNGAEYRDVFTNSQGTATTTAATLTVDVAPTVTANPASQTINHGRNASFTVAATGNPTPTVQWQVSTDGGSTFNNLTNTGIYSGVTTDTLSLTAASLAVNSYQYRAILSNTLYGAGSPSTATTSAATLSVNPTITLPVTNMTDSHVNGELSLREALAQVSGDIGDYIIDVPAGTIDLTQGILSTDDPGFSVTINGTGSAPTVVDAQGASAVMQVTSTTTASITNFEFTGGYDPGNNGYGGGGIENAGTLTLHSCTVTANSDTQGGDGGGIGNLGTLIVMNSAITANSTDGHGGGIYNDLGTLTVVNSTIAMNSAGGGEGGGICNIIGVCTVTDTTVDGNEGGGVFDIAGGTLLLQGSIVADSTGRPDLYGTMSGTFDLIGDGSGSGLTSPLSGEPMLSPLGSYGGSTQTMAPLPGSPAIAHGGTLTDAGGLDQRGITRSLTAPTIGAFESQGFIVTTTNGSGTQDELIGTPFSDLQVHVASNDPSVPLTGGIITLTAPQSGANAILGSSIAALDANGNASVTASASTTPGSYSVIASAGSAPSTDAEFSLTNDPIVAPAVTTNPTNETVNTGSTASFTAVATGSPTPTQHWQVSTDGGASFTDISNGGVYTGATTGTLSITGATTAMNGREYRDVFTNGFGTANTNPSTLTVEFAPTVTENPTNANATPEGTASFTVAAAGNPAPTVQWQVSTDGGTTFTNLTNNGIYSGVTSDTLTVAGATLAENGYQYQAVFSNSLLDAGSSSTAKTTPAILTVGTPVITVSAYAQLVSPTSNTGTLHVQAIQNNSDASLTYTWSVLEQPTVSSGGLKVGGGVGSPAPLVMFAINGTNAAKNTPVTFLASGTYTLQVVASNGIQSATSQVQVTTTVKPSVTHSVTQVSGVQPVGSATSITGFVVTFNGPMDPNTAQDVRGYRILQQSGVGNKLHFAQWLFGIDPGATTQTYAYKIASAVYDSQTDTVALTLATPMPVKNGVRLVEVMGTGRHAVLDANGKPVDGDANGKPGGNFVYRLSMSVAKSVTYQTADGNTVKLTLTGPGKIVTLLPTGSKTPVIDLIDTNPTTSVLTGKLRKGRKGLAYAILDELNGTANVDVQLGDEFHMNQESETSIL